MIAKSAVLALSLLTLTVGIAPAQDALPSLQTNSAAEQLVVDGEPFLIRGGELGNSSASSLSYLEPHWETFRALNLNTVLAPVAWEMIEPEEGAFDFRIVDGLIEQAEANDMKLVLLWFGTWKNSMSTYVPGWVKRDRDRFPHARVHNGEAVEILSPFAEATMQADAAAYGALLTHLAETDANKTVIMMQVENEIGMLGAARDFSDAANAAWGEPVPTALADYLDENRATLDPTLAARLPKGEISGTWSEVFGTGIEAEELFMAWHFARFTERVTAAGKEAYPLPAYVNAAQNRPDTAPGDYPAAGPLAFLKDIWLAGAPSVDFLAPDIYFENFSEIVQGYDYPGNTVFIPEANRAGRADAAANALHAIGAHDAIGFSPFSIESITTPEDNILSNTYAVLEQLTPQILAAQAENRIEGVRPPVSFRGEIDDADQSLTFGDTTITVRFIDPWTPRDQQQIADHGGLIFQTDEGFTVVGTGITLTFADDSGAQVGLDQVREMVMTDSGLAVGRWLNGDQTHQGRHIRLPPGEIGVQTFSLYTYE